MPALETRNQWRGGAPRVSAVSPRAPHASAVPSRAPHAPRAARPTASPVPPSRLVALCGVSRRFATAERGAVRGGSAEPVTGDALSRSPVAFCRFVRGFAAFRDCGAGRHGAGGVRRVATLTQENLATGAMRPRISGGFVSLDTVFPELVSRAPATGPRGSAEPVTARPMSRSPVAFCRFVRGFAAFRDCGAEGWPMRSAGQTGRRNGRGVRRRGGRACGAWGSTRTGAWRG